MTLHIPGMRSLRTFEAAGRLLNFSRAADELGLTPAAVSHQIKEYEDQLGVVLFVRNSRSMRLTEAGAALHEAAAESLGLMTRAANKARKLARGSAQLRVTLDPTCASKWLLPRIEGFHKAHPDIALRFDISSGLRDFDHDDVDVGIRFGAGKYPGLCADRLFDNVIVPVCSPALLRSGKPLAKPSDLLDHTLVHIDWVRQGITWPTWKMWMAAAGIEDFDDSICVVFRDSSHVIQAALDGNAVALADFAMVAKDLSQGRLIRPFELGIKVPPEFAYFLVYPETNAGDPRIAAFREWILAEARSAD